MHTVIGNDIAKAARLLIEGYVVALPTETVYGLGANALNEDAVKQIYRVKNRPQINPLILHIAEVDQAQDYAATIPDAAKALIQRFCPGPLTLVLPKKSIVPSVITAGKDTVAIRIPDHPLAHQLLTKAGIPVAAPSANPSGYISPTTAEHVYRTLGDKVSYILDGGACNAGIESTIVGFNGDVPVIYRQGVITAEDMIKVIGKIEHHTGDAILAPGMSLSHYKPATQLVLTDDIDQAIADNTGKNLGIITWGKYSNSIATNNQLLLSAAGAWHMAAHNLYAAMHIQDNKKYDLIIVRRFPPNGIGQALNDRLQRAAVQ